jgi:hypothetical protein
VYSENDCTVQGLCSKLECASVSRQCAPVCTSLVAFLMCEIVSGNLRDMDNVTSGLFERPVKEWSQIRSTGKNNISEQTVWL